MKASQPFSPRDMAVILVFVCLVLSSGCGCSTNARSVREEVLADMSILAFQHVPDDEIVKLFDALIQDAEKGDRRRVYGALAIVTLLSEEQGVLYDDYIVRLLKSLGDEAFSSALHRQDGEVKDFVCSILVRDQWLVDDDEQYERIKASSEDKYPKTKKLVFEWCK